jgi:4-hydroxymandelate oxidase
LFVAESSRWAVLTQGERQYHVAGEDAARQALDPAAYDYYGRGAGQEITLYDNVHAWRRWAIRPRVLAGVETVDLSTELLGTRLRHPLVIAPMARHNLATPEAEAATVAAAVATDTPCCVSVGSSVAPQQLAEANPTAALWFQTCIFRDRGVTDELAAMATDAGYRYLVVTVDNPAVGLRNHPAVRVSRPDVTPGGPRTNHLELDPSLTWPDLERFISRQSVPVMVKGIMDRQDAVRAAHSGVAAVIVSNHGGRQLDRSPATADVLAEIVDSVAWDLPVLVDGGIRSGADVVTALALGARAVLVGRPILWSLAIGGRDGAIDTVWGLVEETATTMALAGLREIREITRDRLMAAPRRALRD